MTQKNKIPFSIKFPNKLMIFHYFKNKLFILIKLLKFSNPLKQKITGIPIHQYMKLSL